MTPDREYLEQCARDTGFDVAILETPLRWSKRRTIFVF